MLNFSVVSAIFRKDMRAYLGNPTGYVFITLFIFFTGAAAFVQEDFFSRNLADLASLNEVIAVILMFFVPAITMNAWAEERRAGTDELLLTLPLRDGEVVLGKYLGVLGMYTLSLGLTAAAQLGVLWFLGEPDKGLMFSTMMGYWLIGALFVSIGLVASLLSVNTTVAFILGGVGCGALVATGTVPGAAGLVGVAVVGLLATLIAYAVRGTARGSWLVGLGGAAAAALAWQRRNFGDEVAEGSVDISARMEDFFASWSVEAHFTSFGEGVIRFGDLIYFLGGIALMLYLCTFLLGRRHW